MRSMGRGATEPGRPRAQTNARERGEEEEHPSRAAGAAGAAAAALRVSVVVDVTVDVGITVRIGVHVGIGVRVGIHVAVGIAIGDDIVVEHGEGRRIVCVPWHRGGNGHRLVGLDETVIDESFVTLQIAAVPRFPLVSRGATPSSSAA